MPIGVKLAFALAAALIATAVGAVEVTYRGSATFVATRLALPLANNGAAVHLTNDVVATIEPSESGFIYGDCAGLGYLSPKGKYSVDAYCTFAESAADAFDIRVKLEPPAGGDVKIIGGRGKWLDAAGIGTITPRSAEGSRGSFGYEFKIVTP